MSSEVPGEVDPRRDTDPGRDTDPVLRLVTVSADPLDVARHEAAVEHPRAGGRVVFCGVVREHDHGRDVTELEYEAHPSAEQVLTEVAAEIAADPEVLAVAVSHRTGLLGVGDIALVAAVATAHRRAAFEACARLVEETKARLPVWKRQVFTDGSEEWVNLPMTPPAPAGSNGPRRRADDDGEPVLPQVTRDELDEGWGDERASGERDDDWYRRERPPHHG